MDGLDFVVLNLEIGVKEFLLINFSWRSAVIPVVTALSLLSGQTNTLQACCGLFGGDWFDGGWGAGYAPYSVGYYGGGFGYTSYYAPAYYGPAYSGGCNPCGCGPACGYGCNSCAPGCASCIGGNCGVTHPANNSDPARPSPDDGFRSVPNDRDRTPAPDTNTNDTDRPPRRRNTFDNSTDDTTTSPRSRPLPNDGIDDTRGNRTEPATEPATDNDSFESGLTPRNNRNSRDRLESNRPATDNSSSSSSPPPDDSIDSIDSSDESSSKANKPDLGKPVPGDSDTIIPGRKKPAPTNAEPKEEKASKIELPDEIELDDKSTSQGVAPKTRLAISGRYGTPKIVRLKLRPTSKWLADPQPEMIARH